MTNGNAQQAPTTDDEPTRLMILPLPGLGGVVTRETALIWLRDDFPHFHTVSCNVGAEGADRDTRNAAMFLSLDLAMAHEACIRAIETGTPQSFERDDDPRERDVRTQYLARICGARHVMNHSTGPFEGAFDELAEELARRLEGRRCDEVVVHA
jgi:hypothetical protein